VNKTAAQQQVPHNWQSTLCFTLIHVQLLAHSCAWTNKISNSLFIEL